MTVLVTGATGALGVAVVERLQAEGRSVRVLTRRPFRAEALFASPVGIEEWHPDVEPPPLAAFDGVEAVIHLMGEPLTGRPTPERVERFKSSRARASARIIEAMGGRQWRFIVASRSPISLDADAALGEASPRSAPTDALESAVLGAEAAAQAARSAQASVVIVRLGMLLSTGGALERLVDLASRGIVPDLRGVKVPAIDLPDAAAILAGLVSRPDIEGPINAVAPQPLSGPDLAKLLAGARSLPLARPFGGRIVSGQLGLAMPLVTNRAHIVPQRLIDIGGGFASPDPLPPATRVIEAMLARRREGKRWPWS